jgi:hypothetical protein
MSNPDESGKTETKADESGSVIIEAETLRKEIESLKAIKEKLVQEQNAKNAKHRELKERSATMEEQLRKLQEDNLALSTRFEESSKERQSLKEILEKEETKKKQELDSLKMAIPEEKKGLLVESLPVDVQLDFIKKNATFLLGVGKQTIYPAPINHPPAQDQVLLTQEEEQMVRRKGIPLDLAREWKTQDPNFFKKKN